MKKFLLLSFLAITFSTGFAQTGTSGATVKIASRLDSLGYPVYGTIYKIDKQADFYIIASDNKPIQCNMLRVYAYYKDFLNGSPENNYWVYQGKFDFNITPYYKSYSIFMNAHKIGKYKIAVSGYLNNTFLKDFGRVDFDVRNDLDILDLDFLGSLFGE